MSTNYDIIVIPQLGTIAPADHMSAKDFAQAKQDWSNYEENVNSAYTDTWTVAIAHAVGNHMEITTVMDIPNTSLKPQGGAAAQRRFIVIDGGRSAGQIAA